MGTRRQAINSSECQGYSPSLCVLSQHRITALNSLWDGGQLAHAPHPISHKFAYVSCKQNQLARETKTAGYYEGVPFIGREFLWRGTQCSSPMNILSVSVSLSLALSGWLVFLSDQGEAFLTSSVSHHHHLHCRSPRWHTLMDRSRCKSLHVTCTLPPHTLKHSRMWSTLQTNSGSTLSTIHVSLQVQYSYQCNLLFIVQGHFIQGWQLSFLNLEPPTTVTVKGVCLVVCTQMWEFPKWHEILQTHLRT